MEQQKNNINYKEIKRKINYDKITGEYSFDCIDENNQIKKIISPISICWMIENACNLDCIYCFAQHKNLNNSALDYKTIINNILKFNPVTLILTGGEPTLNKDLKKILTYINDKTITIIDSNGTYLSFEEMIPYLNNSVVRFSIDSVNTKVIEKVRPSKVLNDTSNQIIKIKNNIHELIANNIPVIIQTVVTKYNKDELDEIHDFLIANNIKRWYISAVKYCEKCKDSYMDIGLSEEEIMIVNNKIISFNDINATFSLEEDAGAKARLFVEKSGKFFVDTILNGIEYVGKDPYSPSLDEIYDKLDCSKHYDLYIKRKNLVKRI